MKPIVLFQDNTSTITMVSKGRSTSERTRHIDKKYFFISDRVKNNEIKVIYKSTKEMIGDILTKPLQGNLFNKLRKKLLNCNDNAAQECVEDSTPV